MDVNDILQILLKLGLAFFLGALVGYQREKAERPAGLRTHVLVSVGAAVFTLISVSPFIGEGTADPSRIASQVVVGIGFIGAGAIINQGDIVVGLTTAASLWATAAIGMASGGGYYAVATITTIFVYLTLSTFKIFEKRLSPSAEHGVLYIELIAGKVQLADVEKMLRQTNVRSKTFELNKSKEVSEYRFYVELPSEISTDAFVQQIISIDGVNKARWEGVLTGRDV